MEAVDTAERPDRVPRAARFTAVLAVLCAAPVALWVVVVGGAATDGAMVLGAVITAAPLFARDAVNFRTGCLIIGWVLFAVSVFGCIFGLFVLLPASVVLLAAATQADPQAPRLPMYVGIVITAATLGFACWGFGQAWIAPLFREPDTLFADVQEGSPLLGGRHTVLSAPELGHGAVSVDLNKTRGVPGARLAVGIGPHTSAADLAELRRTVADLPGVSHIRICNQQAPDCR